MRKQMSFSDLDHQCKRKKTSVQLFLERMEGIVPFKEWCDIIKPFYYNKNNGRPPIELEVMLRMYLVSVWYNLSDLACEDFLYESGSARRFVGIIGDAPDSTTLCKFRILLEQNKIPKLMFEQLRELLEENKLIIGQGTIVDASIISAPDSTKNKDKKANPEMGVAKKGQKTYFGIKTHIGVDKEHGYVHSVETTSANVSDISMAHKTVRGDEEEIIGDAGYTGIQNRYEISEIFQDGSGVTIKQKPSHGKPRPDTYRMRENVQFIISKKRGKVVTEEDKEEERKKSQVRAKVEHAFMILKHIFKFRHTRYRTIAKNEQRLLMLFASVNLYRCTMQKVVLK